MYTYMASKIQIKRLIPKQKYVSSFKKNEILRQFPCEQISVEGFKTLHFGKV